MNLNESATDAASMVDGLNLFGFSLVSSNNKNKINKNKKKEEIAPESFVGPSQEDGSALFISAGEHQVAYHDLGAYYGYSDVARIVKYREISNYPEVDQGIEEIVNELITIDDQFQAVEISLDETDGFPEKVKKTIEEEFQNILSLLAFSTNAYDIARKWYIDGRLVYHVILNEAKTEIVELRPIDPIHIKKIKEVEEITDPKTRVKTFKAKEEYFVYSEANDPSATRNTTFGSSYTFGGSSGNSNTGLKISKDSIVYVPSGLLDESRKNVISYLHKAIKVANQLRMMEDSLVIYRMVRAPERRVFRIDVGGLPAKKAEAYIQNIIAKYRNKITYDHQTGELMDARQSMAMIEDFWLPSKGGCFALDTKISLLDGRDVELAELIKEYKEGKLNWTYSVSPNGMIVPGLISWAGVTKRDTEVIDVHLDNGEVLTCTPEHKFILRNGKKIEAKDMVAGTSLMPFQKGKKQINAKTNEYEFVVHPATNEEEFTHRMVCYYFEENEPRKQIHHIDFNRLNNSPENLQQMGRLDHMRLHSEAGYLGWNDESKYEQHCENLSIAGKKYFQTEKGKAQAAKHAEHLREKARLDKTRLSPEEYYNKYIKPRTEGAIAARNRDKQILSEEEYNAKYKINLQSIHKQTLSEEEYRAKYNIDFQAKRYQSEVLDKLSFEEIGRVICKAVQENKTISNSELFELVKDKTNGLIKNVKSLRKYLIHHGYESISGFIIRNLDDKFISNKRKSSAKQEFGNHKVLKVVYREDKMDVGTITVDGNHIFHDYHNFALTSGIFVMNSGGTQIDTLSSGETLGQLDDVLYFQKKLFRALNVPLNRLEQESQFSLGRSSEITRDEVKFSKFISKLRSKFSDLFYQLLRTQLILKNVITADEWIDLKEHIFIDFLKDNYFTELKEAEILKERLSTLREIDDYVGKYFSKEWIQRNVLRQSDNDIEEITKQIEAEKKAEVDFAANAQNEVPFDG